MLEDPLIDTNKGDQGKGGAGVRYLFPTYTAPRLSEFEMNRYSFPSAIS